MKKFYCDCCETEMKEDDVDDGDDGTMIGAEIVRADGKRFQFEVQADEMLCPECIRKGLLPEGGESGIVGQDGMKKAGAARALQVCYSLPLAFEELRRRLRDEGVAGIVLSRCASVVVELMQEAEKAVKEAS